MSKSSKKLPQDVGKEYKNMVLDSYFMEKDCGRFTSQEICDNLRDTVSLEPDEVTQYMFANGYVLARMEDRLVWTDSDQQKRLE